MDRSDEGPSACSLFYPAAQLFGVSLSPSLALGMPLVTRVQGSSRDPFRNVKVLADLIQANIQCSNSKELLCDPELGATRRYVVKMNQGSAFRLTDARRLTHGFLACESQSDEAIVRFRVKHSNRHKSILTFSMNLQEKKMCLKIVVFPSEEEEKIS